MSFIDYSLKNPLTVNLVLVLVVVAGVLAWRTMPQELFPPHESDMVRIKTEFEGASPAEVEKQVTIPIEEEFDGVQDIDYITSMSREGWSSINIQLETGTNVDDFMAVARTTLDRIDDLPDIAEEPELSRFRINIPVITLSLFGAATEATQLAWADDIKRELLQIPGIANVGLTGTRDWEIWVIVDPHELAALGLSLDEIRMALRNNLRDQPGGRISSAAGDVRLRGSGVAPEPAEIENIVLAVNERGGQLRLGEVARVERRFEEPLTYARFNEGASVNLTVMKSADASTITVARLVREFVEQARQTLPSNLGLVAHTDASAELDSRLNAVKSSGLIGLLLVLLSLCLLINFRVALVTAMGIPVAFLFAVALMHAFDYSINRVSLFGFFIVLGMIVDDAVIVAENIYRHLEQGKNTQVAAQIGAREVFWPIIVATFTTIAAFAPMLSIAGPWGELIKPIPFVVCVALLGSLLEVFIVLPSHAADFLKLSDARQERARLNWEKTLKTYDKLLRWSVANRYFAAGVSIGILFSVLYYAYTRLDYEQFTDTDTGQFIVNIEAPTTYSLEDSLELAQKLETSVLRVIREEERMSLLTNVGAITIDRTRSKFGSNLIQMTVALAKPRAKGLVERWVAPVLSLNFSAHGKRIRSSAEIIDEIRAEFSHYNEIKRFSILEPQGGPSGADISVGLTGRDIDLLQEKADELVNYLNQIEGVKDVRHDQDPGKLEYRYALNDTGRRLGITQSQLARAVRSGFLGDEAVHVTWTDKRIPVRIIYPENVRAQSAGLFHLPIVLADGRTVYLGEVADISMDRGLNRLSRRDGKRMATISAEVDANVITSLEVTNLIQQQFAPAGDDYDLQFLGLKKEAQEALSGMSRAALISLLAIFFMLVILFKSVLDPFIIMAAIPFGLVGVVIGHALFNYNLEFVSVVGVVALSGIIVNDSLLMVDLIKRLRREGVERVASVVQAARARIRPILLTSVTTFVGVSPLIFFASNETRFLTPMALSLGFGLMFATFSILLTLPCFYLIADDLRRKK